MKKTQRYSKLKPFNIKEKLMLTIIALDFFSSLRHQEISKLLGLEIIKGKVLPFSLFDFLTYLEKAGRQSFRDMFAIRDLVTILEKSIVLTESGKKGGAPGLNTCYFFLKKLTSKERLGYLLLTEALGFELILHLVSPFIIQVIGKTKAGDDSAGTGTIINARNILTCAHVLSDMQVDEFLMIQGKKIKIADIKYHPQIDVGIIYLEEDVLFLQDLLFDIPESLSEILTIGYPKIPFSKSAELIYQKGEVNGFIEDFYKQNFFLFSAIARPGNSGGPIFSKRGKIIGLVTKDLPIRYIENESGDSSEKTIAKHIVPFFAGVPTSEIIKAVNEIDSSIIFPFEDYE